jgi:hypothetical protein
LPDEQSVARYRVRPQDWSRQRTLTFIRVVVLLLTGHNHALQNALKRFFRAVGLLPEGPTASAYSQARQKLEPALFQRLNTLVVEQFYTLSAPDGGVKRGQGRRVLGIDGTMINLPDTEALREDYPGQRTQHAGVERVQALGRVCYDLLNTAERSWRVRVRDVNRPPTITAAFLPIETLASVSLSVVHIED